ncbi:hypothetical protein D3C71_2173470 [compost metagenome]
MGRTYSYSARNACCGQGGQCNSMDDLAVTLDADPPVFAVRPQAIGKLATTAGAHGPPIIC